MSKKALTGIFLGLVTALSSLSAKGDVTYDYIIVGNGTAGAVLARKLTDSGKKSVLVLEAGINHDNDPEVLNTNQGVLLNDFTDLTFNPKYAETYGVPVFFPLTGIVYSEGRSWGGSSLHNYMQVIRGTPDIYDAWATLSGNPLWNYANTLPRILSFINYTPCLTISNPSQEGMGGPISITQTLPVTMDPFGIALNTTTGTPFVDDINDPTQGLIGISAFQAFATATAPCSLGVRSFSSREFLDSVTKITPTGGVGKGSRLLRIESNAYVNNIIFDGKKAIGVRFFYSNQPNKALKAYGKKIILCAGSINTPAILQRSGIGDPAVLEPLAIKVRINNPNVGANLVNQYGGTAIAFLPGGTNATPFFQALINGSTTPALPSPFDYPNDTTRRLQLDAFQIAPDVVQILPFLVQPNSRGSVKIVNTNPLIQPLLDLNMYSDGPVTTNGTDANLSVATYQLINAVVTGAGGTMIYPPPADFASPATLLMDAKQKIIALSHTVGTCRMGTSPSNSVVDGNLHVHGAKNLMIVDASAIPKIPNGSVCFGVYMLAEGALSILGVSPSPGL